jgi:glycosyltransferase involved in cell wall biosynthesis
LDKRASTFSYALGQGLNIGFLAMSYAPDVGGVQTLMTGLAREYRRLGHQVFVLCLDMSGQHPPFSHREEEIEGVRVRRVAYAFHDHRRLADLMRHKQLEEIVLAWLAETPCDVIHAHHLSGFGAGALGAIQSVGQPLVLTLHDYWLIDPLGQMYATESPVAPEPEDLLNAPPFGWAVGEPRFDVWVNRIRACWPHLLPSGGGQKTGPEEEPLADDIETVRVCLDYALEQLDHPTIVLSPSAAAAEVFVRAGVPPGRIRVCENGVDVTGLVEAVAQERARLAAEAKAAENRPAGLKLGILGSVLPSKGALEFVQAFIEAAVPDLRLEIHGNQPPYHGDTRYLERLRRLCELYPAVSLNGPYTQEQLPRLLAGLDGVVAPSRWEEVFGLTVREARAAGLPILVSDTGALAAAAEGGLGGWIVSRDDRAAWVAAIREFASDAALRQAKAKHAIQPHSLETMAKELLRHYAQAIFDVTGRDLRAKFAPPPAVREAEKRAVELELGSEHSAPRPGSAKGSEQGGLLGRFRRWLGQ